MAYEVEYGPRESHRRRLKTSHPQVFADVQQLLLAAKSKRGSKLEDWEYYNKIFHLNVESSSLYRFLSSFK